MSFLEKDIIRREAVDQKIANQLELEEGKQAEQEFDSIIDSMVFVKKAIDGRPPGLYYLIHWKGKTHVEDTWEPVEGISHLRRLLKKYHGKNLDKPTATSLPVDKGAPPPLMAAHLRTKITPSIPARSQQSPLQLRRSKRHQKS